jgi:hypothetical protein
MKEIQLDPCPHCGSAVSIFPSMGGRGTGEFTVYQVECQNAGCQFIVKELGGVVSGAKASAIRQYNKLRKTGAI